MVQAGRVNCAPPSRGILRSAWCSRRQAAHHGWWIDLVRNRSGLWGGLGPDLHPGFAAAQQHQCLQQGCAQHLLERSFAAVTQPQPDHLGRGALFIQQADEVPVLGHHHRPSGPCPAEDLRIAGIPQAEITHSHSVIPSTPDGRSPGRRNPGRRGGPQAQIREVGQDLLAAQARGIELQHIPHANAHPPNAGLPAALLRVVGDA